MVTPTDIEFAAYEYYVHDIPLPDYLYLSHIQIVKDLQPQNLIPFLGCRIKIQNPNRNPQTGFLNIQSRYGAQQMIKLRFVLDYDHHSSPITPLTEFLGIYNEKTNRYDTP